MKWSSALVTKMRESDIPQFRVIVFSFFFLLGSYPTPHIRILFIERIRLSIV